MDQTNTDGRPLVILRTLPTNLLLLRPCDILAAYKDNYIITYIAAGGILQKHKLGDEPFDEETIRRLAQFAECYDNGNLDFYAYTAFLDQLKARGILKQGDAQCL